IGGEPVALRGIGNGAETVPARNEAADERALPGKRGKIGGNAHTSVSERARERPKDTGFTQKCSIVTCARLVNIIVHVGAGSSATRPSEVELGAFARGAAAAARTNRRDPGSARGFDGRP